jgi:hypothetical protein
MPQRLALAVGAAFALLLTLAGLPALALVFGCVAYLTVRTLRADRQPPMSRENDELRPARRRRLLR